MNTAPIQGISRTSTPEAAVHKTAWATRTLAVMENLGTLVEAYRHGTDLRACVWLGPTRQIDGQPATLAPFSAPEP